MPYYDLLGHLDRLRVNPLDKRYKDTLLISGMNPKQTLKNMVNTMKMAKKSDKDDYMQHLRLVLLGIGAVGSIGFIIQFVFSVLTFG